jgi:hypothetical protein
MMPLSGADRALRLLEARRSEQVWLPELRQLVFLSEISPNMKDKNPLYAHQISAKRLCFYL